ncbi:MAG TPA: bifunctional phosphoribosylaminoimidazolecarboxamide formyltransferase/IMP cyclohydrolase [Lacipirellulaceae bacterium]|jgi:phosphoribosylaminoimidazolecarboxamide formyltransferase/IMP cyclohydrolase|nr:bifunctional phosphoribosylaminoimidazolecarboxamide formyltransferase/IMP cyclohydrolase [Lacipirellulaceae bacterium]
MDSPKIERALISVSDKTGLIEFSRGLVEAGVEIYASGGTRRHLEEAGVDVREVAAYTGFPEMMDGRIKTLHPKIHGGILCRRDNPADMLAIAEQGIVPFELVVVNLYPFKETVSREDVTIEEAIEQIDIGGPTLIRAAAKNHAFVTIACEPAQYERILDQLRKNGMTTLELRRQLAGEAFVHTAKYDGAIAVFLQPFFAFDSFEKFAPTHAIFNSVPSTITVKVKLKESLRYGENPHQLAALYVAPNATPGSLVRAEKLHGKELSYNNLLDLDSALSVARSLPKPGVAVLKHNNPCGAATAATLGEAMRLAWEGDSVSAFGSVLGFNVPIDAAAAEFLAEPERFVEAIVAPDFTPEAFEILTTKPKWKANVRLLKVRQIEPGRGDREFRQISGGMLCQAADDLPDDEAEWKVVTNAQPSDAQRADLRFAWAVCRHVKSNAIVLARDQALVGVGAGQMSRVDSVEIAIRKAAERARGSALASDAFFPFADSIEHAAKTGIAAIIQPGGSRRDNEVIAACNRHALPMIFTGRRHFRH